jgi:hypothetical protein
LAAWAYLARTWGQGAALKSIVSADEMVSLGNRACWAAIVYGSGGGWCRTRRRLPRVVSDKASLYVAEKKRLAAFSYPKGDFRRCVYVCVCRWERKREGARAGGGRNRVSRTREGAREGAILFWFFFWVFIPLAMAELSAR